MKMENNIDRDRAIGDYAYFIENCVNVRDKDGNIHKFPPLKDYQKRFLRVIEEAKRNGKNIL